MVNVKDGYAYGSYFYDFTIQCNLNNIPYQLSFDRDLYFNRTNVILLNYLTGDDNDCFCPKLRETVCNCFLSFFEKEPLENVHFEIDLSHNRNSTKLLKFYRWSLLHPNLKFKIDVTERDDIFYAGVKISIK